MQSTARKNELPLDKMSLVCEVTKKQKEEMNSPPREGAYIHGLFMEGARYAYICRENTKQKSVEFIHCCTFKIEETGHNWPASQNGRVE